MYVEADNVNDEGMMEDIQPQLCPQRIRRPPDCYGIYVEHKNLARMEDTRREVI